MISKARWMEMMRASGLDKEAMANWHKPFELMAPKAHQEFLECLQLPEEEIANIRQWAKPFP